MRFEEVPYIKLTSTEKKKALEILNLGVVLLKKWASYYPKKKYRVFRNEVMAYNGSGFKKLDFNNIPCNKQGEFKRDIPKIQVIKKPNSFLGGRSVEEALLQSFSAMAKRHVQKWNPDGVFERQQDLLQEAYLQIVECLYSWTACHKVEISTFIWVSLKNRMSNFANQQNLFCPLTNSDLELRIRYERAKNSMNKSFTFDEIVETMELSEDDRRSLTVMLKGVVTENQLKMEEECINDKNEESNDYTTFRVTKEKSEAVIAFEDLHVQEILERSNLTSQELELIQLAMNPYSGWQTEYAKTHINPKTRRPYTRMRITQILAKARVKVAMTLDRKELVAA